MDEIYVATDIEADGPSPGQYSMLSLASVAFRLDKSIVSTFQRNLEPLPGARQAPDVMKFWADNPDAWAACRENPVPPKDAMNDYSQWLGGLGAKPVLVAHPVGFDFPFVHWYLHEFTGGSPMFPAALDIASYAMAVMRTPFTKSHKPYMPKEWIDPKFPHTHKAWTTRWATPCFSATWSRRTKQARRPNYINVRPRNSSSRISNAKGQTRGQCSRHPRCFLRRLSDAGWIALSG